MDNASALVRKECRPVRYTTKQEPFPDNLSETHNFDRWISQLQGAERGGFQCLGLMIELRWVM
ncbi:hypothetical protein QQP08_001509 [Theobroma cacao]|nr:hypothetical protein QQP08_001509 [Theobroma cacao]